MFHRFLCLNLFSLQIFRLYFNAGHTAVLEFWCLWLFGKLCGGSKLMSHRLEFARLTIGRNNNFSQIGYHSL